MFKVTAWFDLTSISVGVHASDELSAVEEGLAIMEDEWGSGAREYVYVDCEEVV